MNGRGPVLITGGAGFIGTNLARRLASEGRRVLLLDDLSRAGVAENLRGTRASHAGLVDFVQADVRDASVVRKVVADASAVFHFAAQVAVTTSLDRPVADFETNVRGTLNVLEAIRARPDPPPLVFSSTNKVYGSLPDVAMRRRDARYEPVADDLRARGVDESRPLDFHSPYGCSKGAADQYVRDYGRTFGLPTVVLRLSCIYGVHQQGNEDQGWVAHFLKQAMRREPITIYGDGRQVRDVLFVDDLVEALLQAEREARRLAGNVYNLGGGAGSTLSLLELLDRIRELHGRAPVTRHAPVRPGDQPWYVSNVAAFRAATGWSPKVSVDDGLARLHAWLEDAGAARGTA